MEKISNMKNIEKEDINIYEIYLNIFTEEYLLY